MNTLTDFAFRLEEWYSTHGRDLPWRRTTDPYRIWISEIILQQTRVVQGMDYYARFLQRFPDVQTLAAASEDEVLRLWQGLGYYSRARNLHAAAQSIVQQGGFPQTYEEVRALKGIGDYTAAAICSFAFQLPCAVVDGNVYRVLSRYFDMEEPIDSTRGKKQYAQLAQELLDAQHPALYNQAIMDFGAMVCTPLSPLCAEGCPLADSCGALASGRVGELPVKSHKTQVSDRYFHYIFVQAGDSILLHQRTGQDVWKNLYEVPLIESSDQLLSDDEVLQHPVWQQFSALVGPSPKVEMCGKEVVHVLSHRRIHTRFFSMKSAVPTSVQAPEGYFWAPLSDLSRYAVSRLVSLVFEEFL